MSNANADERVQHDTLELEYELDAPPEKVWRAISIPEFRERWLPSNDLADTESVSSIPGKEISYRIKDNEPPFSESEVTFQIRPNGDGGTALTIVQTPLDDRFDQGFPTAANDEFLAVKLAA